MSKSLNFLHLGNSHMSLLVFPFDESSPKNLGNGSLKLDLKMADAVEEYPDGIALLWN